MTFETATKLSIESKKITRAVPKGEGPLCDQILSPDLIRSLFSAFRTTHQPAKGAVKSKLDMPLITEWSMSQEDVFGDFKDPFKFERFITRVEMLFNIDEHNEDTIMDIAKFADYLMDTKIRFSLIDSSVHTKILDEIRKFCDLNDLNNQTSTAPLDENAQIAFAKSITYHLTSTKNSKGATVNRGDKNVQNIMKACQADPKIAKHKIDFKDTTGASNIDTLLTKIQLFLNDKIVAYNDLKKQGFFPTEQSVQDRAVRKRNNESSNNGTPKSDVLRCKGCNRPGHDKDSCRMSQHFNWNRSNKDFDDSSARRDLDSMNVIHGKNLKFLTAQYTFEQNKLIDHGVVDTSRQQPKSQKRKQERDRPRENKRSTGRSSRDYERDDYERDRDPPAERDPVPPSTVFTPAPRESARGAFQVREP